VTSPLPPWPGELHDCTRCGTSYGTLSVGDVVDVVAGVATRLAALVAASALVQRNLRPAEGVWSVNEYVWHLRDLLMTSTIRLHRIRKEDQPTLEPMLNDLRARRFRYRERDAEHALPELGDGAAGFLDEVARTSDDEWQRTGWRLAGEQRTALWVVRNAAHECVHHLGDIRDVTEAVQTSG